MTISINLQDFLSSKRILHNKKSEYENALLFLIENINNINTFALRKV